MTNKLFGIVSTEELHHYEKRSDEAGLNRLLAPDFWKDVDPDGLHCLNRCPHPHNGFVRTYAMCKMKNKPQPCEVFLDLRVEDWNQIYKK